MKYDEIRSKIKSGDVLAWSHRGWKTLHDVQVQLVRVLTQSEYSHVGIAWVVAGRVFVIEAVGTGVRIMPLSMTLPFYHIGCGKSYWSKDTEKFLLSTVGARYSKIDAMLAFFNALAVGENDTWQCSELVHKALSEGGLIKEIVIATPTAIVEFLLTKGFTLQKVTE
jgi:hypothetical protein